MLTTVDKLKKLPGIKRQPLDTLNVLLGFADQMIKDHCKQNLEQATYTEYYSGNGKNYIILRQLPVQSITSLYLDANGRFGKPASSFPAGSLMDGDTQYSLILDRDGLSYRGLVERVGGSGSQFTTQWPEYSANFGKLTATRQPSWPLGSGNIKVVYVAGFPQIPESLEAACATVVGALIRNIPQGTALTSETLGAYSYQAYFPPLGQIPELGSVAKILSRFRDYSL